MKLAYPKLVLLILSIVFAYVLFRSEFFLQINETLNGHGYLSILLAGFLFSYGFTAPFAVGMFIAVAPKTDILFASLIGGIGAAIADFLIFQWIRSSFRDEFEQLKLNWLIQKIRSLFNNHFSEQAKKYILWTFAGFLIASPLPDEFGVSLISGFTDINKKVFAIISYALNTIGISVILWLSS